MRFIDAPYSEFYPLKRWFSFPGSKPASLTDVGGHGEAVKAASSPAAIYLGWGGEGVYVAT